MNAQPAHKAYAQSVDARADLRGCTLAGKGESRPGANQDGSLTLDPHSPEEGSMEPKRTRPAERRGAV